ncbi:hypothetical protein [Candidatus Poriferisocius sp.]|uniref:hypothetical protein n=1 Tax=Candidatus Poriferisocius sp. TaxID=3101276 RepID=UPI003B59B40C
MDVATNIILSILGTGFLGLFALHLRRLEHRLDTLEATMHRGFEAVDRKLERIDAQFERIDSTLSFHGERLAGLESRWPPRQED